LAGPPRLPYMHSDVQTERSTWGVRFGLSPASEDSSVEELIKQLREKAGIDQANAEKVSATLEEKAAQLPNLISGNTQGLVQMLQKAGIDEGVIQKVVAFVKQNADKIPAMLAGEGGLLSKAKEMVGGMLGRKPGQ
jgi:hypothetical protein